MDPQTFYRMYGYIISKSSAGEGSRGGKIIGHTPAGKPIYESQQRKEGMEGRKPYPGEESHNLTPIKERQKTFMPKDGTEHAWHDTPNLKAYKTLLRQFKRQGIDFMGHISYDPKTDAMVALTPEAPALIRQVYNAFMAERGRTPPASAPKKAG